MIGNDLEERLTAALTDGLRTGDVDVASLVAGARVGARRVRRRRRVAVGAAVAVGLALPLGAVGVAAWQQGERSADVASTPSETGIRLTPSATTTPGTVTADPTPPPAPEVDPTTLGPGENAVEIPLDVLPVQGDLPRPMVQLDATAYRLIPVAMGQACNLDRAGTEPIAGASDQWAEENSNRLDQLDVSTNVTAYSRGQGAGAFAEATDDTGACRWLDTGVTTGFTTAAGNAAFSRVVPGSGGQEAVQTVVTLGDVLVGVQVRAAPTGVDGLTLSRQLAETVAARVVGAQVPGSGG